MIESNPNMDFFYIRDRKHHYRFFCSEPLHDVQVRFSRWEKFWETAKKKLMLLPRRDLAQEQAFARIRNWNRNDITIKVSGCINVRKSHRRFYLFLQKKRSQHVLLLILEAILLPISGVLAFLPGPNVFFGVLALIMITHWQALRGINHLSRIQRHFSRTPLFREWEEAVDSGDEDKYPVILDKISQKFHLEHIRSIL